MTILRSQALHSWNLIFIVRDGRPRGQALQIVDGGTERLHTEPNLVEDDVPIISGNFIVKYQVYPLLLQPDTMPITAGSKRTSARL